MALQLHSQVGHWSLSSGHFCRMNNNLCKMKLPQSGLSKRSRELQEGFSHGTRCVGQQECSCEVWGERGGSCGRGVQHMEQGSQYTQLKREGCTQSCESWTDTSCKATPCCPDGWQSLSAHAWALFFTGLKESNSL